MTARLSRFLPVLAVAVVTGFAPSGAAQEPDGIFQSANDHFERGEFEEASQQYLNLVHGGFISSDLYYNLGTTLYRLEKPGEAMLWFRRARLVESHAPEVAQNLSFLKGKTGFLEFADSGPASLLRSLPPGTGTWLGSLLLWTAAIAAAAAFFLPRCRPRRTGLIASGIVLAILGVTALRLEHYRETKLDAENFATVTVSGAKALTAPSPSAKAVIDLPPGSEVRIIQASGPWRYLDIPGELRGWVRAEEIEPLWPIPSPQS